MNSTFKYADRELIVEVRDILTSPVDVIVVSNNTDLSANYGLVERVSQAAGDLLRADVGQLVREYGELLHGMAMSSRAGELPFKAVIHAVPPQMGVGGERRIIEQVVTNSLLLCESNNWSTIAFPSIGAGSSQVPIQIISKAIIRAVLRFWDARMDTVVEKVVISARQIHYQEYINSIETENTGPLASLDSNSTHRNKNSHALNDSADESQVEPGNLELSENEIADLDNDELSDWFK